MPFNFGIIALLLIFGMHMISAIYSSKMYKSANDRQYYIENSYDYDWFESWAACARMNMTLLAIENKQKADEVNPLVSSMCGNKCTLWVGGYAVGPSRRFTWMSTGIGFSYYYWFFGNPDFFNREEYCVQIGWFNDMRWNDNKCSKKYGYICEYTHWTPPVPAPIPTPTPKPTPPPISECNPKSGNNMTFNFYYNKN